MNPSQIKKREMEEKKTNKKVSSFKWIRTS